MLFNKKKKPDMIDIRELQKRGVVKIPKKRINIPSSEEFIELHKTKITKNPEQKTQNNADFFGFMNTSSQSKPEEPNQFTTQEDGYNKREIDTKITSLDNKIYKLEQRLELLEKKLDINQPTNNTGVMGW
jgi:hypothetical protein